MTRCSRCPAQIDPMEPRARYAVLKPDGTAQKGQFIEVCMACVLKEPNGGAAAR